MSETRARFVRSILERMPVDRIVEVHLFPPIRQGGLETGVAVIAATPEPPPPAPEEPAAPPPAGEPPDGPEAVQVEMAELLEPGAGPGADAASPAPASPDDEPAEPERAVRHTVYMARYRSTLKGPDRGKWEFDMVAEADAPLVTVDAVVRGVQRRAADAADPERLAGDALLAAMDDVTWTTAPK